MREGAGAAVWQVLDVGSIWMKEFAAALGRVAPVVAWEPVMARFGALQRWERVKSLTHPVLDVRRFPLQRGYATRVMGAVLPFERGLLGRLGRAAGGDRARSVLVCSTPFYAPVAERWPGPVVYYSTDLTHAYEGLDAAQVKALDRRMCRAATVVAPNSRRIAEYFVAESGCDPAKITVVPNATRASNVMAEAPAPGPGTLPDDLRGLARPVAGVLGDLSGNMDWLLMRRVMELAAERLPELEWAFVGPTTRAIADAEQNAAREWAKERAVFTGAKPYGELQGYARSFDVAVLPYRRKEPTFSGSSTRFYEHLAACRPMVATRGFAELMDKPPLLRLVDTAEEMVAEIEALAGMGFADGQERARWEASRVGTWEERARMVVAAVEATSACM